MIAQATIPYTYLCDYPRHTPGAISGITDEIHMGYISEVVDYINKNYSKDITLNELTRKAYLSKFHFSRIFKKHTSYSPYQYLLAVRLYHSKQLLLDNSYSIKEVADLCGFKRLDYFSSIFKKKFKCNPTQYREDLSCGRLASI